MSRGKIVLTPFPFTNLAGQKLRPALVVSRSDRPDTDLIVAFVGSYHDHPLGQGDLLIETTHPDYSLTGLKRSSFIRLDKLVTIDESIVKGEIGYLSPTLIQLANTKLCHALEL